MMQKRLARVLPIALATFLVAGCTCGQRNTEPDGTMHVLYVGNSFTFYHDMPTMFAELARTSGHEVVVEVVAPGGQTLSGHAASATTTEQIASGDWNYVIVQEHSATPIEQNRREEQMYPAARALDQMIQESGSRTILFVTWGYRDGLPDKEYDILSPVWDKSRERCFNYICASGHGYKPEFSFLIRLLDLGSSDQVWRTEFDFRSRQRASLLV